MSGNSELSTDGPVCPYCGKQIRPDDPAFYSEDYSNDECPQCDRKFEVSVSHQVWWETFTIEEKDPPCTDCGDTGTTLQTDRPCSCGIKP